MTKSGIWQDPTTCIVAPQSGVSTGTIVLPPPNPLPPPPPPPPPPPAGVPQVINVSPNQGPIGTVVTITGTNFTGATSLSFGFITAPFTRLSDSQLIANSPSGGAGRVDVTVTGPGGSSAVVSGDSYTFTQTTPPPPPPPPLNGPQVTSVTPSSGTTGTLVTVGGVGFTGITALKFGNVASNFTFVSDTQVNTEVPANLSGTVDVVVTTNLGTSAVILNDQFTFTSAPPPPTPTPPTVTTVTPKTGTIGSSVNVTGSGFTGSMLVVRFGTVATSFTVASDTQLTAVVPTNQGTVDVTITTANGTSAVSTADQFTYPSPPPPPPPPPVLPGIASIFPSTGPVGTSVAITGVNFSGTSAVNFGATAATFTLNSTTSIAATAPAGSGIVDITVVTPSGTSATSAADQFTYISPPPPVRPAVTSVVPNQGQVGSAVVISGAAFTGVTAVKFGSASATFTFVSDSQIRATAPQGTGTVDITVTTSTGGVSSTSVSDRFTYQLPGGTIMFIAANLGTGSVTQFTAVASGVSVLSWAVNSVVGGNTTIGTITTTGLYTAPSTIPSTPVVTISAFDPNNAAVTASIGVQIVLGTTPPPGTSSITKQKLNHAGGTYLTGIPSFTADENTAMIQHDRALLYLIARTQGSLGAGAPQITYGDANWQSIFTLAEQVWSADTLQEHYTNQLPDDPTQVTQSEINVITQMAPTNASWLNQINALPFISTFDPTSTVNTTLFNQVTTILGTIS